MQKIKERAMQNFEQKMEKAQKLRQSQLRKSFFISEVQIKELHEQERQQQQQSKNLKYCLSNALSLSQTVNKRNEEQLANALFRKSLGWRVTDFILKIMFNLKRILFYTSFLLILQSIFNELFLMNIQKSLEIQEPAYLLSHLISLIILVMLIYELFQ